MDYYIPHSGIVWDDADDEASCRRGFSQCDGIVASCGAFMAPVAISIATQMGVSPLPFCMALIISVSSSFGTPIGSPTYLMVYVPGGYRFIDFVKIGLPMNFIILAANIFITVLLFPF